MPRASLASNLGVGVLAKVRQVELRNSINGNVVAAVLGATFLARLKLFIRY